MDGLLFTCNKNITDKNWNFHDLKPMKQALEQEDPAYIICSAVEGKENNIITSVRNYGECQTNQDLSKKLSPSDWIGV